MSCVFRIHIQYCLYSGWSYMVNDAGEDKQEGRGGGRNMNDNCKKSVNFADACRVTGVDSHAEA